MAKKGFKGLNMLVLGGGGLLLVVLFFLGAFAVKEGFDVTDIGIKDVKNGNIYTTTFTMISTAETKEKALADLKGFCSLGKNYIGSDTGYDYIPTSATVSGITVSKNHDGTFTATGKCTRIYTKST